LTVILGEIPDFFDIKYVKITQNQIFELNFSEEYHRILGSVVDD